MLSSLGGGEFVARYGAIRVSQAARPHLRRPGSRRWPLVPRRGRRAAGRCRRADGPRLRPDHRRVVRAPRAHDAAGPHGAHLLDQADRRAGGRRARRRRPARARAGRRMAGRVPRRRRRGHRSSWSRPSRRVARSTCATPAARSCRSRAILAPLRLILRTPSILELSLTGCAFAAVQVCLSSFLVVYLTDALGWSLVAAGLALTCTAVAAVPGRMIWGAIADRTRAATRVLAVIGAIACVCGIALAASGPGWPTLGLLVIAAAYGASAIGWNGVQLSEVARRAPAGRGGIDDRRVGLHHVRRGHGRARSCSRRRRRGRRLPAGFPRVRGGQRDCDGLPAARR